MQDNKRPLRFIYMASTVMLLGLQSAQARVWWNYISEYDQNGRPDAIENVSSSLPDDLLPKIYQKLPERLDIRDNSNSQITGDSGANIKLLEDAEVRVIFLAEGAGYKNSIGYFTFKDNAKPATQNSIDPIILFPNFSANGSGGGLNYGDSVGLGIVKAGTSIGFNIISNGWRSNWNGVNPWPPAYASFTTLKETNPEYPSYGDLEAHTVLLIKDDAELAVIGMEDINRTFGWSDHDFNDAIIGIQVSPFSAIDRTNTISFDYEIDTDGDGIPDYIDMFPNDATRVSRTFYPSAEGFSRLAFEDNWPKMGDFDMNDLVVSYRVSKSLNTEGLVTDLSIIYNFDARGALLHNGFGVHLEGIFRDEIDISSDGEIPSTTIKIGTESAHPLLPEVGQSEAVFIVSDDVFEFTENDVSGCSFFNTINTCPSQDSTRVQLDIKFANPVSNPGKPPFNPFIFRSNYRGLEIHLVDKKPTDLADTSLFGTQDDSSNISQVRYYRTEGNLPWAMDIPGNWDHPHEGKDIIQAYPDLQPWAESSGESNKNWHLSNKQLDHVFHNQ